MTDKPRKPTAADLKLLSLTEAAELRTELDDYIVCLLSEKKEEKYGRSAIPLTPAARFSALSRPDENEILTMDSGKSTSP